MICLSQPSVIDATDLTTSSCSFNQMIDTTTSTRTQIFGP